MHVDAIQCMCAPVDVIHLMVTIAACCQFYSIEISQKTLSRTMKDRLKMHGDNDIGEET